MLFPANTGSGESDLVTAISATACTVVVAVPVGNVNDQPLDVLWNGPLLRRFRRTLLDAGGSLPACARCCGVIGKPAAS